MKAIRLLWVLTLGAFLIGAVGVALRLVEGHAVTANSTLVPWGLWVAGAATLVGVSAGACLVAAVGLGFRVEALRPVAPVALLAALAALVGGLALAWLDVGHPGRVWHLFVYAGPGAVTRGLPLVYLAYGLLLVALLPLVRRESPGAAGRLLLLLALALGAILAGAEGSLYGVVGHRIIWEPALAPGLSVAEGALAGTGVVLLLAVLLGDPAPGTRRVLRGLLLALVVLVAALEASDIAATLRAGVPARAVPLRAVLGGAYWWVFWLVHVGAGLLLPFVVLVAAGERPAWLATAGALIGLTALSAKLNLVLPALAVPDVRGLPGPYAGPALSPAYLPTVTEWLVLVWAVSLAALVVLAGHAWLIRPRSTGRRDPTVRKSPHVTPA